MNRYEFDLTISPQEFLDYYRGTVRTVLVRSYTGQTVQFPASLLRRFLRPDGIQGSFVLTCDTNHRNPSLERLD